MLQLQIKCGSEGTSIVSCSSHNVRVKLLSPVGHFVTPWTVAYQAPLSMGILQARTLEWVAIPSSRGSSPSRDRTQISCSAARFFTLYLSHQECPSPVPNRRAVHSSLGNAGVRMTSGDKNPGQEGCLPFTRRSH